MACAPSQRRVGFGQRQAGIAKPIDNRIPAVAAKISLSDLNPWRRLPPLVLGEVEHTGNLDDQVPVEPSLDDGCYRLFALDQPLENLVENIVWWERILIGLIFS